jgi:hypothetical protein
MRVSQYCCSSTVPSVLLLLGRSISYNKDVIACAGLAAAQWLSLRLQVLAASVITLVAGLGVAGAAGLLPSFATQAGGCVTFSFPMPENCCQCREV